MLLAVAAALPTTMALLPGACAPMPRRAALMRATTAAIGLAGLPHAALADLMDLDLGEADAPAPMAIKAEPIKMVTAGEPKPKKELSGPAARLKELQSKNSLTDKEKKELRKLKADEMCEMLGRGC